jgi:hypothetical protein
MGQVPSFLCPIPWNTFHSQFVSHNLTTTSSYHRHTSPRPSQHQKSPGSHHRSARPCLPRVRRSRLRDRVRLPRCQRHCPICVRRYLEYPIEGKVSEKYVLKRPP